MRMLHIDAQEANKLLTTFVNDHRQNKSDELGVTHTIMGNLKNDELKVILVREENVVNTKACFKTIHGENIYSVQKHKNIDAGTISLGDHFNTYNPEHCDT